MPEKISVVLLRKIMLRMGEFGNQDPKSIGTSRFLDLVASTADPKDVEMRLYVNAHLKFLRERNFLRIQNEITRIEFRTIELTAHGHAYLQPEVAEFGNAPMLPQVVKSLENRIQVLTYPDEEKSTMIHNLRDAVAGQVPDLIVKAVVEICSKLMLR